MVQEARTHARPSAAAPAALFRRILVPVDFSTESRQALAIALELQRKFDSEVQVITLTEFGENEEFVRGLGVERTDDDLEESAGERLRHFVEHIAGDAIGRVTCRALEEVDLPYGVNRCANEWGATIVLLTSHRTPGLFRTQCERIANALSVPVIVLKAHGAARLG